MPATRVAFAVAALILLRPNLAEHDRVDRLEMRRVGGQREMDGPPADLTVARGAEMVFDVARAMDVLGLGRDALELGEDRGEGLADEIGQHVEPAAMRHADHELPDAELAAAAQDRLQRRHQRFGTLDAEALGAGVAAIEKPLEGLGRGQGLQDLLFHRCATAPVDSAFRISAGSRRRSAGAWMCMYSTPILPQ